ncbi:hypothetical protein [Leptolyngbya sp. PCC 6406]|uniref:hypothetical protein n=1 Tax=Leptolyngbya sp. PCC 6406 TaxID=1173264 RepID=UPI0002AC7FA1|nr:hypothetical protein [Leptolyngbya sp. PCC 6406]
MPSFPYTPPVAGFLDYGKQLDVGQPTVSSASQNMPDRWPNYIEIAGLTINHIPELITLVQDDVIWQLWLDDEAAAEAFQANYPDRDPDKAFFAPIHAWRALGQLQVLEAVPVLAQVLSRYDLDWCWEEIPWALSLMGPDAIAPLLTTIANPEISGESKVFLVETFDHLVTLFPESRDACIAGAMEVLANYEENIPAVNGNLCVFMVQNKVVEAADLLEAAHSKNCVDIHFIGTWATVQVELGLKSKADFSPEEFRLPPMPGFEKFDEMLGTLQTILTPKKPSAIDLGLPINRDHLSSDPLTLDIPRSASQPKTPASGFRDSSSGGKSKSGRKQGKKSKSSRKKR